MKFTYATTILIATAVHSAPNPDAVSKLQQLLSDASAKAIDAAQGYVDNANIKVDLSGKASQMMQAGQDFVKSKQPEFDQWMKKQGYEAKMKEVLAEATKIRNKNKKKTPGQILDALNIKINSLTRANVKNANLKSNLVKLTKSMKGLAKDAVSGSAQGNKKASALWRQAANNLELEVNRPRKDRVLHAQSAFRTYICSNLNLCTLPMSP